MLGWHWFYFAWAIWFDIWKYHMSTDLLDEEIWLYKDRLLLDDILKFVRADIVTKIFYCILKDFLIHH